MTNSLLKVVPKKEALTDIGASLGINYDVLVPFRENYKNSEIIYCIVNHPFFKKNDYSEIKADPFSDEVLGFSNLVRSLIVTYDKTSLNSYEAILKNFPGKLVLKLIRQTFNNVEFPDRKLLLDFIKKIKLDYPFISTYFDETEELLEFCIRKNRRTAPVKRAIPPEEREKNL